MVGGTPWKKECPSFNVALSLKLAKWENALWHDFESKILGVTPSNVVVPTLKHRLLAEAAYWCAHVTNALGIKIGRARLQRFVADYDGRTSALATARQELFGDIERWR